MLTTVFDPASNKHSLAYVYLDRDVGKALCVLFPNNKDEVPCISFGDLIGNHNPPKIHLINVYINFKCNSDLFKFAKDVCSLDVLQRNLMKLNLNNLINKDTLVQLKNKKQQLLTDVESIDSIINQIKEFEKPND
jgi:hypothetical protein